MPRRSAHPALFAASERHAPPGCVVATIDGAARGNPGPAAYGVVFEDAQGKVLAQLSSRLGRATNNVAEYRALRGALTYAREHGWRALRVRTDSELLARQLDGAYKVKSADLKPLHQQARQLIAGFEYFHIDAVPRKLTRSADKLANAALDSRPVASLSRAKPRDDQRPVRKTTRAVYQDGILKPLEPLDLPDGTEVELLIRQPNKS